MSFQPVVVGSGLAGWRFIERTYDAQFGAFGKSAALERETEYFKQNIGSIKSASDLVSDRRLLSVALGAFGLKDDLNNRYFIQKILEDGTLADSALANRLADERYGKFSQAFGFGPGETLKTGNVAGMSTVLENHKTQEFEIAVGETDETMRIALYTQHSLVELANSESSDDALWFRVMGTLPLRSLFETALGLPQAFGQIDIDRQLGIFKASLEKFTGDDSIQQFRDPESLERITNLYLARSQLSEIGGASSSALNALFLLQSAIR
ncbi:MAG: flagellar protein [Blastopirellula sp.]|nr:MAG: flagellar protein [Blastopirellula sp.]